MDIDKIEQQATTNTSNTNENFERRHQKFLSTKESLHLPLKLKVHQKTRLLSSNELFDLNNSKFRRDIYGSLILKGGRKHKVSFIDSALPVLEDSKEKEEAKTEKEVEQKPIAQIVNVQSYKEYTLKMAYSDYSKYPGKETVCCDDGCAVF